MFTLKYSTEAYEQYKSLEKNKALARKFKAVTKALKLLRDNPRHPSLNTHEYTGYTKEFGVKVYEAYAENNTPRAYRIFWFYGDKDTINVLRITPHP